MAAIITNGSATSAGVVWGGGRGQLTAVATFGGGSVGLDYLGPDGTTWLAAVTALTANGMVQFLLPPGQIRVSVATATAVYANVDRLMS